MNQINYQTTLEILVEELSMESFLNTILPKILPANYRLGENCFIRRHDGKEHLKKSIANKVNAYKKYPTPVKLVIIQDQDLNDCKQLKNDIEQLVKKVNSKIPLLIRIACRELENWYLGDLQAVEQLYPESRASKKVGKRKFRNPDEPKGSKEMDRLSKKFRKYDCAQRIGEFMDLDNNRSASFNAFINGIQRFCE